LPNRLEYRNAQIVAQKEKMRPGPTIIRKCSSCAAPIKQTTIKSGNTFGAIVWTDGKIEAPMLPDLPLFVKCPHCSSLLWIDEQLELRVDGLDCRLIYEEEKIINKSSFEKTIFGDIESDIPKYIVPSANELFTFLDMNISDVKKEQYLRVQALWAGNDARRTGGKMHHLSKNESRNLQALSVLLNESNNSERIMKAEIMRELGRFDDALSILAFLPGKELMEAFIVIKELAHREDPFVSRIPP
jgi:hypothetical protein